jgi:hypothetical protein
MNTEDNLLEQIISLLVEAREDYDKFCDRGNSAAGTRVRKTMQDAKALAQDLRIEIQNIKNNQ